METENNDNSESGDYSRFGIPDAPKTTVTTPFGKRKTWAGLSRIEKAHLFLSLLNIVTAIGLSAARLGVVIRDDPDNSDFAFTILIIVNSAFVAFYAIHGVLRERRYELYVQTLALLIILVYCIVQYSSYASKRSTLKLVRLIVACVLAPPNITLAVWVAREFGELEFRIAGASEHLQHVYNEASMFSCLLKFDLQVTASFVILALKDGTNIGTLETVTLSVGVPYTIFWCILGWLVLRLELKLGVLVFVFLGLAKPAYYTVKFIRLYTHLENEDDHKMIFYCIIICGFAAVLTWTILMIELVSVYRNFGQGLRERGKVSFGTFILGRQT